MLELGIKDLYLIDTFKYGDNRGSFEIVFKPSDFPFKGVFQNFIQWNRSYSKLTHTVRGLHYQRKPYEQAKLIKCEQGSIFDVTLDLRIESETFGKCVSHVLNAKDQNTLFLPRGVAHGFMTLEADTEVSYLVDNVYKPDFEETILWNDPDLNVAWPSNVTNAISDKDRNGMNFRNFRQKLKIE